MEQEGDLLIDEYIAKFSSTWLAGEILDKVHLLTTLKTYCETGIKENQIRIFNFLEPYYVEIIRHANPKIFIEGLNILQIQINSQQPLRYNITSLVSALCVVILVKKEYKDKAVQLLLSIFEQNLPNFVEGIKETLTFKEPKSIIEILRFFNLLIVKNDEKKMEFLKGQLDAIADLTANFSTSTVRQTGLELLLAIAEEFGFNFIANKVNLLKDSQRVQIQKRLKTEGIADEVIQKIEAKKTEALKVYKQNREVYKAITQQVIDSTKDRENFLQNVTTLSKKDQGKALYDYNIINLSKIPLYVDKIKYAKGKVKIHVMKEIHDAFMHNPEKVNDEQLLASWKFDKYFSFDNPLMQKQLIDILIVYINKMSQSDERRILLVQTLKTQIQGIITSLVKSLCLNHHSIAESVYRLTKYLMEDPGFKLEVLTSLYDAMLNKSDSVQISALFVFQNAIIQKKMSQLPKMDTILHYIAQLTNSHSGQLRYQALQTLVSCAAEIGVDIYNYTACLNKFQASRFQQSMLRVFSQDQFLKIGASENNEADEEQKDSQSNEKVIEELKIKLCHKHITNEEEIIYDIKSRIKKQYEVQVSEQLQFVSIFEQLMLRFGDNIINNTTYLIGKVCDSLLLKDQITAFQVVYSHPSNINTTRTLTILYQSIGFKNLKQYFLDSFYVSHEEEKVCSFLQTQLETVDEEVQSQFAKSIFESFKEIKDPKTKVTFINFLAKIQMAKNQTYLADIAELVIQNKDARTTLLQKIDQSCKKYQFLSHAKKNPSDEVYHEKEDKKKLKNEVDEEQEKIAREKKEKSAISFKEFRKQQLQKLKEDNDDGEEEEKPQQQQHKKVEIVANNNDDEI